MARQLFLDNGRISSFIPTSEKSDQNYYRTQMLKTITLISQIKLVCNPKDIRPPMEVKKAIATDFKRATSKDDATTSN